MLADLAPMSPVTPEHYVTSTGESRWKVRYRDGERRHRSRTFTDQRGARELARLIDQLGPMEAIRIVDERLAAPVGTLTLADWCTQHIDGLSGVQPDTARRYRTYVANDLGTLGPLPLTAVSEEAVAAWVNALAAAGASGKTIKNKHGFLSAVLERAARKHLIPANPCKGTRLPRTVTEPMVFLTHDEYARFIGYVTPHWQPLVATLFATGLRWGEATALQVGDVDLHRGTASVVRAWKAGNVLGPPKSRRSRRTIALAPETVELLRPLVQSRPADAFVFTNTHGSPVRLQTFSENVWAPAVRLANGEPGQKPGAKAKRVARRVDASGCIIEPARIPLGKRPRIHDARHTCASWLLGAGIPITYVQDHLGHESITTTSDRYGHVLPAARFAIANAMSMALTQAHPQLEA